MAPGVTLEVGCGSGALIEDLRRLGHVCEGLETSPEAWKLATSIHQHNADVRIHAEPADTWQGTFDYVLAFEVLEHIEDDGSTLKQWAQWLKADGYLLISAPAHKARWSASDVWAGHFRRYERADLTNLMEGAGFTVVSLECYGFPLANAIEPVRAWLHARALHRDRKKSGGIETRTLNTHRSGVERNFETGLYPLQSSLFGQAILRIAFGLQHLAARTEWGTGYLAVARKR